MGLNKSHLPRFRCVRPTENHSAEDTEDTKHITQYI